MLLEKGGGIALCVFAGVGCIVKDLPVFAWISAHLARCYGFFSIDLASPKHPVPQARTYAKTGIGIFEVVEHVATALRFFP